MEFGKAIPYNISIEASANRGFRVSIGCTDLVFSHVRDLIGFLSEYLADPEKMVKEYNKSNMGGVEVTPDEPRPTAEAEPERRR